MTSNTSNTQPTFSPVGDQGLLIRFGDTIDESANRRVRGLMQLLHSTPEIRELIPAFCSLLIFYDPAQTHYARLLRKIQKQLRYLTEAPVQKRRIHLIPVCYGGTYGEDITDVAAHSGLTPSEVIQLHTERDYLIYMLGFLPGFAYLGELNPRLFCPRLNVPRTKIPTGSVGIGGEQTGIYPLDSPGGWRLIGRTPLRPYDPNRKPQFLYEMGEYIRFYSISEEEYHNIENHLQAGEYQYETLEEDA